MYIDKLPLWHALVSSSGIRLAAPAGSRPDQHRRPRQDTELKAVADTVGGAAPGLVARFKNSLNRTFQRRGKLTASKRDLEYAFTLEPWLFICLERAALRYYC